MFYFPPTIIDFYVKVMKKRFSPVLRIFMKKSQYSCTIDHGYVTDYDIRIWLTMAAELSDIFDSESDDSAEESHQNTMSHVFQSAS